MAQCRKCGKKGLFARIDRETGLCPGCKAAFAEKSRHLMDKITAAKNEVSLTSDPARILKLCTDVQTYGERLTALQLAYTLQPSQELIDLIEAYKKIGQLARDRDTVPSSPGSEPD